MRPGRCTLVLLPGLDGTGQLFDDFIAALGPDIDIIVAAYPLDALLSYTELASVARTFIPADRPYFLLGESFSGPIAITIAAASPPGLRGMILCCSFARNPRPILAWARPLIALFPLMALPLALLSHFLLGRFASPHLRLALAQTLAKVAPAVLRQRAVAALGVDVSQRLSAIAVPLLYLRASEDRVVPKSASDEVAAWAPVTRIVDLVAPHFLLQALPSAAASAVADFMAALIPAGNTPDPAPKNI